MKISISSSAFNDFESIKKHYEAEDARQIGDRYIVSMIAPVQTLKDNPDIGRVVPEFGEEKIRELIHPPFRIVYLREKSSIHVIRIWRSERLLVLLESKI